MNVKLIQYTKDCERLVAASAKLCYSPASVDEIFDNLNEENTKKFLKMLLEMGHESPIEHATFTFGIEGVSRSLLAQITRHRIASYTVKSQRYVKEGQFEYVVPPEIAGVEEAKKLYIKAMEDDQRAYNELVEILYNKHIEYFMSLGLEEKAAKNKAEKKAIEDARYVLPNSCTTQMIVTFNARSLFNFFEHRCCERAQWEIRELADKMLMLAKKAAPVLFKNAGPTCVKAACPEGKMSCGKTQEKRNKYLGV